MLGSSHFARTPPLFDSANLMLHPAMMALGNSFPFSNTATSPGSYELLQVCYLTDKQRHVSLNFIIFYCPGNFGQIAIHGGALGALVDSIPDVVTIRPTASAAGIVERTLPTLFSAMVVAVGFGGDPDATADEPSTTARWNADDASRRSPTGDGNQNHSGTVYVVYFGFATFQTAKTFSLKY